MVLHDRTKHVKYENTPWFQRKERESGDVKSTVRAPAKKDGQGGAYTWAGGSTDFDLNFMPHYPADQVGKVKSTASEPASSKPGSSDSLQSVDDFHFNPADFPPLSPVKGPVKGPRSTKVMKAAEDWNTQVMMDRDLKM